MSKCTYIAGHTMLSFPRTIISSTLESTGYSSSFVNAQTLRSFKLQYSIQDNLMNACQGCGWVCPAIEQGKNIPPYWKRLHAKGGLCGIMQSTIACATSAVGNSHGDQNVRSGTATTSRNFFAPVESYPWDKLSSKLMLHFADAVWFVGKWLAVPALVLVALRDLLFTVRVGNELAIPFGLLVGTVFTGIVKETLSDVGINFQHSVLPWHLVALALLFVLLRVHAARAEMLAFQAYFAIGGIWQTIRFALDWKARKEVPVHEEENS